MEKTDEYDNRTGSAVSDHRDRPFSSAWHLHPSSDGWAKSIPDPADLTSGKQDLPGASRTG